MTALSVHHVNLCTPRGESGRVAGFYARVFGFAPLDRPDTGRAGAWLAAGDVELHLSERDGQPHPDQHVALVVEDIAAVRRRCEAEEAVARDLGAERLFVRDPAGNLLEVLAHADAAR